MKCLKTKKSHFHYEEWIYDDIDDIMYIYNTLQRIK